MTREEKSNLLNELLDYEENNDIGNLTRAERREFQQWISKALDQEPTTKNDLALIHTEGLDEEIRCAMCTNSMKSDRGCDGGCVVNNAMYKEVMDVIENHIADTDKMIEPTTKNDLGISSGLENVSSIIDWNNCHTSEQLDSIATTKNDLAVDKEQLKTMIRGLTKWYVKRDNTEVGEPNTAVGLLYDDVMFGIDRLPSVTPQEPRWIPVSERLPEEDGEYYATVYDTDENYKYMDIAELEDGIWQYKDYIKVLAWMPLPKPYKAESENT